MIRHCLVALGSWCLLGACGSKFSAGEAEGGASGSLGGAGSSAGGSPARAGSGSGARSGNGPGNDAGADSGGTEAAAGSETESGGAGVGGGPIVGHGGNSGSGGAGGGVAQPVIPQLGLALWLRADLGVQQMDGLVQSWLDQSGNQRNATQTGVNLCPEYLAKGLNDLPSLQFDGVAQFLNLPKGDFGDFSRGLAGFMVLQPLASDCASALEFSNGSEFEDVALGMWLDKWTYEVEEPYIQMGTVDLLAPTLYAVNHSPALGKDAASAELWLNGALVQTLKMPTPIVPATGSRKANYVGRTLYDCNYFKGTISEIILYERAVTPNEVKAIEAYLAQHWDLGPVAAP